MSCEWLLIFVSVYYIIFLVRILFIMSAIIDTTPHTGFSASTSSTTVLTVYTYYRHSLSSAVLTSTGSEKGPVPPKVKAATEQL